MTARHIGYWDGATWRPWCEVFPTANFPRIAVDPPFDGSCQDCLALAVEELS